jgi:Mrp family chromosome partitioning ATPase
MGRVYKALLKADKWADINRPIGRPVDADFVTRPTEVSGFADLIADRTGLAANRTQSVGEETAETTGPHLGAPPHDELTGRQASFAPVREQPSFEAWRPTRTLSVKDLRIDETFRALRGDVRALEWYAQLALNVLIEVERRNLKTLVVTSAAAGEGKTTIAANLAWALSRTSRKRILLMDANLAQPAVAERLGIEASRSLWDLLEEGGFPTDAVVSISPSNLAVMPVRGSESRQEPGFLGGQKAKTLLGEARDRFDLVVIDAPPLLESADARWLVSVTEATAIVARAGRTEAGSLVSARKLVPRSKRLGIVLNEFPVAGAKNRKKQRRP